MSADDLADEARRVLRAIRSTQVPAPERARARALLAEAAEVLERARTDGPYWHSGLAALEDFEFSSDLGSSFPYSPVLGERNPIAPPLRLTIAEDRSIEGRVTFDEQYNGPPFDTAHGGVLAMVYDELLAMAAYVTHGGGMTGRLTVHYRRPTPLFTPITVRAWLAEADGRKFTVRGEMRAGDQLCTEGEALFIQPRRDPG